jgi:hypothetical protein
MTEVKTEPIPTAELQALHEAVVSRFNINDLVGVRFQHCHLNQSLGTVALTVLREDGAVSWIQEPPMSRRLDFEDVFVPYAMVNDWNGKYLGTFYATESITFSEYAVVGATRKLA